MNTTLLHLSLIAGIGPSTIQRILHHCTVEQLDELYSFDCQQAIERCGLPELVAQKLIVGLKDKKRLDQELELIQCHAITVMDITQESYPYLLKNIYAPPPILYIKSEKPLIHAKPLAIVGSRKATSYAQHILEKIVPGLIAHEWAIVSGGALGVDTFAHQITLDNKGSTYVVLGSGLLSLYPSQNKKLFNRVIEQGGALISSFALQEVPQPGNFPARNRIISGLSKGCLVVQAAQKSGALITAHYALDQGREVFAIPGRIDDQFSAGTNRLIQQGAKLVMGLEDILVEYSEEIKQESFLQDLTQTASSRVSNSPESHNEDPLLHYCKNPIAIDELARYTNTSLLDLQIKLFDLQIEGKVQQNFAGLWSVTS